MIVNLGYLYLCLWLLICSLSLTRFGPSGYYLQVYAMTLSSVIATAISFSLMCGFKKSLLSPVTKLVPTRTSLLDSPIFLKCVSFAYLFLILIETFAAGGMPILAIFGVGRQISYVEFGIPGIHGFVNSLGYVTSLLSIYQILNNSPTATRRPYSFYILIGVYIIFALQMHRAVITASMMQSLALVFLFRRKLLSSAWLLAFSSAFAIVFGLLGDLRSGREHFLELAGLQWYPEFLPTGFAWVYIYLITPFINTLSSSQYFVRLFHSYLPFETLQSSIPSFLRPPSQIELSLDSEAWNVHSFFSPLLADYGFYAFLPSILIGVVWALCFAYAKRDQRFWPIYSVAFMQVLFTCFGSLSFHTSFLFEMFIFLFAALSPRDMLARSPSV